MNITTAEREALYKVIYNRRDVRSDFKSDPIPDDVLNRILGAAHHAPSVGFMQPWDFIIVKDAEVKRQIKVGFEIAHAEAAEMFEGDKRELYKTLKLEGITESPVGICVTCDRNRTGPVVIGRTENKEMDLYSSVCAVQNLWLAARAENVGVGWVSIISHEKFRAALNIPAEITPIAYLCMGYVRKFHDQPELETVGWLPRAAISDITHHDQWGQAGCTHSEPSGHESIPI